MKNESEVLPRMLKSVLPLVNSCSIVDTGSIDDSISTVKSYFSSENKPFVIKQSTWKWFAENRNEAINIGCNLADYGLILDCDEEIELLPGWEQEIDNLDKDAYIIPVKFKSVTFDRLAIFKMNAGFYWEMPIHNVLMNDNQYTTGRLECIRIISHPDGKSWTSQQQTDKYKERAAVLEEFIMKHPEEKWKPRWLFYMAQTYRDAGMYKKAVEWYKKRVDTNSGSYEERYIAQLHMARIMNYYSPKSEVIYELMKCSTLDKNRAEHLDSLGEILRNEQNVVFSYIISKQAFQMYHQKEPKRGLFVEKDCYSWRLLDNYIVAAYRANSLREVLNHIALQKQYVNDGIIPEREHARLRKNWEYYDLHLEKENGKKATAN